jgi:hypothetical protein
MRHFQAFDTRALPGEYLPHTDGQADVPGDRTEDQHSRRFDRDPAEASHYPNRDTHAGKAAPSVSEHRLISGDDAPVRSAMHDPQGNADSRVSAWRSPRRPVAPNSQEMAVAKKVRTGPEVERSMIARSIANRSVRAFRCLDYRCWDRNGRFSNSFGGILSNGGHFGSVRLIKGGRAGTPPNKRRINGRRRCSIRGSGSREALALEPQEWVRPVAASWRVESRLARPGLPERERVAAVRVRRH